MADDPKPDTSSAPTASPAPGSAVVTPQAAAVVPPQTDAPAASSSPEVPAPVVEPTSESAAAPAPKAEVASSILGDLVQDKPAAEPEPKVEAAPVLDLPQYEKFTISEGVSLDDGKVGDFTKLLGEFESTTKADHAAMQGLGQKLVDFYTKEARETADRMKQLQTEVWARTRDTWKDQFRNDPEIGKNRYNTTLKQAGAVMDRYGAMEGPEKLKSFREVLGLTGAGDHPETIRFMRWVGNLITEQARPVPAVVPKSPQPQSKLQRRYAGTLQQK